MSDRVTYTLSVETDVEFAPAVSAYLLQVQGVLEGAHSGSKARVDVLGTMDAPARLTAATVIEQAADDFTASYPDRDASWFDPSDVRAWLMAHADLIRRGQISVDQETERPLGSHHRIEHDGFEGVVIGRYVTREGKRGVVLQQDGTKVVHVYGEKWLK